MSAVAPDPAEVRARAASAVLKYIEDADGLWANDAAKVVDIVLAFASATEAPPVAGGSGGEDVSEPYHGLWSPEIAAALTKPTPPASVSGGVVVVPRAVIDRIREKFENDPREGSRAEYFIGPEGEVWHDYVEIGKSDIEELLAAAPEAATPSAVPVAWVSPGQFSSLIEPDEIGGAYLPVRKTKAGNFTQPLYATPSAVGGVDRMREAVARLRAAAAGRESGLQRNAEKDAGVGDRWSEEQFAEERRLATVSNIRLDDLQVILALATGETSPERGRGE